MSVNWKKLVTLIPAKVEVRRKVSYEVLFGKFEDPERLGESRPSTKQIVIREGLSARTTVLTYLHELIHAASDATDANLTEAQVEKLESTLYFLLKEGNVFKETADG